MQRLKYVACAATHPLLQPPKRRVILALVSVRHSVASDLVQNRNRLGN